MLAFPLAGPLRAVEAATVFSFISSPDSWVGGGERTTARPEEGYTFNGSVSHSIASFSIDLLNCFSLVCSPNSWTLELAAPLDRPLTVGHYAGASKYPFHNFSLPGMNFAGNGRGNDTITGSFDVHEIVYGANGRILSFAADFLQYDEGVPEWWNQGAIRINSQVPILFAPEPVLPPSIGSPPIVDEPIVQLPMIPDPEPPLPFVGEAPGVQVEEDPVILAPVPFSEDPDTSETIVWPFLNPVLRSLPPVAFLSEDVPSDADSSPGTASTPPDPVPGPLPVAAALTGWQASRVLRRRCRSGR